MEAPSTTQEAATPTPTLTPTPAAVAVRPPSGWDRRMEQLSETLNPIIVKEIRQGLRTKIFWVCFALMLLGCFVISLVAYGSSLDRTFTNAGQGFFFAYFFCLGLVHFFIIPYSAYRSLAREREDETWVLLSLTGIGAGRIIRGKLGSFLAQALLYGSSVGPFMLFSYYLNGIDLPTILCVIALGGAFMVFLTCMSVCAATLGESRLVRGLMHFVLLGALLGATVFGLSIAGALTFDGQRLMQDRGAQVAVAGGLWAMLSFGFLMYQAAAARLALPTEDYAKGPRLALLLQILGSAALLGWAWNSEGRDHELVMFAQGLLVFDLFVIGIFMLTGSDPVHEVHFRKKGVSLLRPGSLRGFRFVLALVGLVTSACTWVYSLSADLPSDARPGLYFILAAGAYAALYLAVPIVFARLTGSWALNTAAGLRALAVSVFVAGAGLPPLMGLVLGMKPDDKVLNLFNPLVGAVNFGDRPWNGGYQMGEALLGVLVSAALLFTLAADRMLAWRESEGRKEREGARDASTAASPAGRS